MGSPEGGILDFEAALDKTGFGLYSYILVLFAGSTLIAFECIAFNIALIIPTSACELETTTAQQGFLSAAPLVGIILGAAIWGYIGDAFGRRKPLIISLLSAALVNGLACISVNWIMLMFLQFFATFLCSGQYPLAMTFLSECVPAAKRNVVVLLASSISIVTQGIMALIAIPIIPLSFSIYLPGLGIYWNSWRTLMAVYSVPSIFCAIWLLFMMETPKYLFKMGHKDEALNVLATIHKINKGCSLEEYHVTGLMADTTAKTTQKPSSVKSQIARLFKTPLLKYTLIMTYLAVFQQVGTFQIWLPTIADQFFQILETGEGFDLNLCQILDASLEAPPDPDLVPCALNNTALLMVLVVAALQSLVNILICLLVNRTGSRNMVIYIAFFCGACGIIVNLVPHAVGSVVLFVGFLMGFVTVGLYAAIAVALFPTSLRALAVALTTTGGRIASLASIQIINLLLVNNCTVAFFLFASIFALSGVVAFFLEDDRQGKEQPELPDDNEDGKL